MQNNQIHTLNTRLGSHPLLMMDVKSTRNIKAIKVFMKLQYV